MSSSSGDCFRAASAAVAKVVARTTHKTAAVHLRTAIVVPVTVKAQSRGQRPVTTARDSSVDSTDCYESFGFFFLTTNILFGFPDTTCYRPYGAGCRTSRRRGRTETS